MFEGAQELIATIANNGLNCPVTLAIHRVLPAVINFARTKVWTNGHTFERVNGLNFYPTDAYFIPMVHNKDNVLKDYSNQSSI